MRSIVTRNRAATEACDSSLADLVEAKPHEDEGPPRARTSFAASAGPLLSLILSQALDVAQALANVIQIPSMPGTFNLPGPSEMTYEYLLTLVSTVTLNPVSPAPILPKSVALALAKVAQRVWWPALSPDEVVRRYIDDADVPGDWDKFGITPDEIEEHAITYLRRYRSA